MNGKKNEIYSLIPILCSIFGFCHIIWEEEQEEENVTIM